MGGNGTPVVMLFMILLYFLAWKQEVVLELQDVYERTKDKFIWNTLVNLKQGFNGWKDETTLMSSRGVYMQFVKILINIIILQK